jgi:gluconolactonase
MSWEFEQVAGPYGFAEGPAWDGEALLFTDISTSRVMRYDPASGECAAFRSGTNEANGLIFDKDGNLFACEGSKMFSDGEGGRRVSRYNADGTTTVVAQEFEGKRLNSPNDLAFDAQGRLWFTDPRYGDETADLELDHRSVYRLDPQGEDSWDITRVTYDTTSPNGILVSPDGTWLYVAQSAYGDNNPRELRRYPINDDGSTGACEVLHNFYPHRGIDGMCWDSDGNIIATAGWEESGPGPMLYVFTPNGRVLETHPLPTDQPTNCTFGDPDLQTLYVTAGGCLFRTRPGRKGYLIYPSG